MPRAPASAKPHGTRQPEPGLARAVTSGGRQGDGVSGVCHSLQQGPSCSAAWRGPASGRPSAGRTAASLGRSVSPVAHVKGAGLALPSRSRCGACRWGDCPAHDRVPPSTARSRDGGSRASVPEAGHSVRPRKPASPHAVCESGRSGKAWGHVSCTTRSNGSSGVSLGHGVRRKAQDQAGGRPPHECTVAVPDTVGGRGRAASLQGVCVGRGTGRPGLWLCS